MKYQFLARILREEIALHGNDRNYRLPTERVLSERYGLSRHTVRHALDILEEEGLINRLQGSGSYFSGNNPGNAMRIALILTFADEYIFPGLIADIESVIKKSGYTLQVYTTFNRISDERSILKELIASPPGGILAEGVKTALPNPNTDLYQEVVTLGVPLVFCNGRYSSLSHIPSVTDDNYTGGMLLTKHLLSHGYRDIGGIFKSDDIQGPERYSGMAAAMRDADIPLQDKCICWYDSEDRQNLLGSPDNELLKTFCKNRLKHASAVICYNDEIAYRLILTLRSMGKNVPEDMAVASFDNSYLCDISPVPFTSLRHSTGRAGITAARMLLKLMHGGNVQSARLPWELVPRKSTMKAI